MLEISNLTKTFGGIVAIDDLSITFEEGSRTGLVGPNGAGKSTLFNLITGEITPDAGTITIAGQEITELPIHKRTKCGIARVYQMNNFFGGLTVKDNIGLVLQRQYSDGQLLLNRPDSLETEERVYEIAEQVQLGSKLENLGNELSHGQKRKLELGLVLASGAPILLMDEPIAGISPAEKREITNMIRELDDRTLILIEHDLEFVDEVVDHVVFLHQGQILAKGNPNEIQNAPVVQEVYI